MASGMTGPALAHAAEPMHSAPSNAIESRLGVSRVCGSRMLMAPRLPLGWLRGKSLADPVGEWELVQTNEHSRHHVDGRKHDHGHEGVTAEAGHAVA